MEPSTSAANILGNIPKEDITNDIIEINMRNESINSLTITNLFPWIYDFKSMCKIIYKNYDMSSLKELMQYYMRNINVSVIECYTKPLWAAQLKDSISDTLVLFLYIYRMLSEHSDRCIYLNYMSDLLAVYIDMELKASRKTKEDQGKISARLISCLYIYLEHSTEHMLDTFMKIQFMCRSYHSILNPVMTKVIQNIPPHPESSIMYVRYLLIYRLWRNINNSIFIKEEITTAAVSSLGPPPTFPQLFDGLLPKVPKFESNGAKFLLEYKFDTRRTCKIFTQFSKDLSTKLITEDGKKIIQPSTSSSRVFEIEEEVNLAFKNINKFHNKNSNLSDNSSFSSKFISLRNSCESVTIKDETCSQSIGKISDNNSTNRVVPKALTKIKPCFRRNLKKSNKIIFIDLTSDEQIEECVINKKKAKKLGWLVEVKKRKGLKAKKTSMKMKRKIRKKVNNSNLTKYATKNDYQLQGTTLRTSKDDAVDSSMCDIKDNDNTDLKNSNLIPSTLTESLNNEKLTSSIIHTKNCNDVNIDLTTANSSSDNNKCALNAAVETVDAPTNTLKYYNDDGVLELMKNNTINNIFKKSSNKKLRKKDISIKSKIYKRKDGNKKICDLKPRPSITESITIDSQCNSKDEVDSLNLNNIVVESSTSEDVIAYLKVKQDEHGIQETLNNKDMESDYVEEQNLSTNSYFEKINESQSIKIIELENNSNSKEIESERCTILKSYMNNTLKYENKEGFLINNEIFEQQQTFHESQKNPEVSFPEYLHGTLSFSIMNGDDSGVQAEVEIDNSIEGDDDMNTINTFDFENKTYKSEENLIDIAKNIAIHDIQIEHTNKEDINNQYINQSIEYDKQIYNKNDSKQEIIVENIDQSKLYSYPVLPTILQKDVQLLQYSHDGNVMKNVNEEFSEIKEINNDPKTSDRGYIMHNTELSTEIRTKLSTELNTDENIDGLSLLASVSQHVSQLNAKSEIQCDQIKVKNYAVIKNTSSNQVINDAINTNDSPNTISQLCENPTTELINQNVGVYPEDELKKVALCVKFTSTSNGNTTNTENASSMNVPYIFQDSTNYETSNTLSNIIVPLENNVQGTEENTNVILNGRTILLLQKLPHSNFYIINKAVENPINHNDNETSKIMEKTWLSPSSEDCTSYEIINTLDHTFIPEKHSVGGETSIKVGSKENNPILNLAEEKLYTKQSSLRANVLSTVQTTLQDIDTATTTNENNDKNKSSSQSVSAGRPNIMQEFTTLSNSITPNYAIQECTGMHPLSHEAVESQHPLHIPASHSTILPSSICNNCSTTTNLCVPYHKHCTSVSCSLKMNTTASLQSHINTNNSHGRSHCSCINRTYDTVTHCRQCSIHSDTDSHVSCIESNSYCLPNHSSVQPFTVQENDKTKNETVIKKSYDDKMLYNVEQNHLQNNTLEKIDMKYDTARLSNTNFNSKLPLKKRLKGHAMMMSMAYKETPEKGEKLNNYPGIPMMSIAALEALDTTKKHQEPTVKPVFELPPTRKDDLHNNYHFNANVVRRDYRNDIHDNMTHESNATKRQKSCHQKTSKRSAQRKEIAVSEMTTIKQFTSETLTTDVPYKKGKKMQSPTRKTRSSKRNVPKVNYSYYDNDPDWNSSGVTKRKRRKISR